MAVSMKRQTIAKEFSLYARDSRYEGDGPMVVLCHKPCGLVVKEFDFDLPLDLNQVNVEAVGHICKER